MDLRVETEMNDIDGDRIVEILRRAGMAYHSSAVHVRAFTNSYSVVFVFDASTLVGFGRAISDGEYQAAIYDVAVLPEYQGLGIGRLIVQNIVKQAPLCNYILYASPGKERFYEKEGFRRMKTGMALFVNGQQMSEKGFTE
jgi:Acetyltransferases